MYRIAKQPQILICYRMKTRFIRYAREEYLHEVIALYPLQVR